MRQMLNDNEIVELRAMLEALAKHYGVGAGRRIAEAVGTTGAAVSLWMRGHNCYRSNFNKVKKFLAKVRKESGVELRNGLVMITRAEAKAISDTALNPPPPTDADVVEWLTDIDAWIRREAAHGETKLNWVTTPKYIHGCSDNENHRKWGRLLAPMLVKELRRLGYKAEADVEGYYPSIKVEWG